MQIAIMGWKTDEVLLAMLEEGHRLSEATANRFTQVYVPSSERRGGAGGLAGRRPEWCVHVFSFQHGLPMLIRAL